MPNFLGFAAIMMLLTLDRPISCYAVFFVVEDAVVYLLLYMDYPNILLTIVLVKFY